VAGEDPGGGDAAADPDRGVILRPDAVVLGDESLVPERSLVRPAPNRFTHELLVDEPYNFDHPERARKPDGVLPAGTPVVLLVDDGERCRVVDAEGLYVEVRCASLRKLTGR
jgi:hypothetical protein